MAYFIVYLRQLKKYVVLPASWIKGIENHFEKFVNNSLNSSQQFLCYYTSNQAAFVDDCPDHNFEPDFDSGMIADTNVAQSFDGCFFGKLKHYHGMLFMNKLY